MTARRATMTRCTTARKATNERAAPVGLPSYGWKNGAAAIRFIFAEFLSGQWRAPQVPIPDTHNAVEFMFGAGMTSRMDCGENNQNWDRELNNIGGSPNGVRRRNNDQTELRQPG